MSHEQNEEIPKVPSRRIIFEKSDGTVTYLEGQDVEKWIRLIGQAIGRQEIYDFDETQSGLKHLEPLFKTASSLQEVENEPKPNKVFIGFGDQAGIVIIQAHDKESATEIFRKNLKRDPTSLNELVADMTVLQPGNF